MFLVVCENNQSKPSGEYNHRIIFSYSYGLVGATPLYILNIMNNLFTPIFRKSQVLCKATTNVSGDVPGSTPSRMSTYERIIETLTTLFPLWVRVTFWQHNLWFWLIFVFQCF